MSDLERERAGPDLGPALSACVGVSDPGGDGGGLGGDQPGALLLAHAAPDPVGLADRQRVLEAGIEDGAPGADGLGRGLPPGAGRAGSPSGWKKRDVFSPRQAPWSCQSQTSATGVGSLRMSAMSPPGLASRRGLSGC